MKFLIISCLTVVLLLGFSGTAQAEDALECVAGSTPNTVRAEGITEVVGDIQIRCRKSRAFGADQLGATIPVEVELQRVNITNEINVMRDVSYSNVVGYRSRGIVLEGRELNRNVLAAQIVNIRALFGNGKLSSNGTSISWELITNNVVSDLQLGDAQDGFHLFISGIRVNAFKVTAGENIFANVRVNNETINSSPLPVTQVVPGLNVTVDAARGLQCEPTGSMAQTAAITIEEGFADAITTDHKLEVRFTGIPNGVQVMVPKAVPLPGINLGREFELRLDPGGTSGLGGSVDQVSLSSGRGTVVYGTPTPSSGLVRTAILEVRFEWGAQAAVPTVQAMVSVSYDPPSEEFEETDMNNDLPRFIRNTSREVLVIDKCTTTMVFPFVTNQLGYETGIVFSNTSGQSGRCDMTIIGDGITRKKQTEVIPSRSQKTFELSEEFPGFQGQMEVECNFQNGDGYAYVLSPAGDANSGYLPRLLTN